MSVIETIADEETQAVGRQLIAALDTLLEATRFDLDVFANPSVFTVARTNVPTNEWLRTIPTINMNGAPTVTRYAIWLTAYPTAPVFDADVLDRTEFKSDEGTWRARDGGTRGVILHAYRPGRWTDHFLQLAERAREAAIERDASNFHPIDDSAIFPDEAEPEAATE